MCYSIYISTDSNIDLASYNNELISFEKTEDKLENESIKLLSHPNVWYLGSKSGCSCTFRDIMAIELGFSEPVDWYEEDETVIKSDIRNLHDTQENTPRRTQN